MADMELNGLDEMLSKIEELGRKGNRIQNKALKKAAEPILKDAKDNAPEDTGKGKEGLKIGAIKGKEGHKYVEVGITKGDISDIYYMKFHEYGASGHQISVKKGQKVAGGILKNTKNTPINHPGTVAKPFLDPALIKNRKKVQDIIKEEIKEGLGI